MNQGTLFVGPKFRRVEQGGQSSVWLGPRLVLSYATNDRAEVRLAIATLRAWNLDGKGIAKLLGVAESSVSRVGSAIATHGLAAAVVGGRMGRPPELTAGVIKRVLALKEAGFNHRAIAAELGISTGSVSAAAQGASTPAPVQLSLAEPVLESVTVAESAPSKASAKRVSAVPVRVTDESDELLPCEALPSSPAEHMSRYAGTLLLGGMLQALGVTDALKRAGAKRSVENGYSEEQVVVALATAWTAGHTSLESMHERDARALGAALGLERSPSVRTLHRALGEMTRGLDPVTLNTALLQALHDDTPSPVYGIDGHFKAYCGAERIDKGWDSKKRLVRKGLTDMYVTDIFGRMLFRENVAAGEDIDQHIVRIARSVRDALDTREPLTFAFDRGGFTFDVINELHQDGFRYLTYVPATVRTPDLSGIAPQEDGVSELICWEHPRLKHAPRLIVQRDGGTLIPIVTNLPTEFDPVQVVGLLRSSRSMQENGFKAARAFMNIDALNDRGGARRAADNRLVPNPAHRELEANRDAQRERYRDLAMCHPFGKFDREVASQQLEANLMEALAEHELQRTPPKVAKMELDPHAQRAWLKTCNRSLMLAIKLGADNARRKLLYVLGEALAPTDHEYDQSARNRTLLELLHAPGSLRFDDDCVHVTLDLLLPPTSHARLAEAMERLDAIGLRMADGRAIRARLAPRPTRGALAHHDVNPTPSIPFR